MGAVLILAPAIIAGWPAITAAVTGAAVAMGLTVGHTVAAEAKEAINKSNLKKDKLTSVELDMAQSEVLESSLTGNEQIVLSKNGMSVRIERDEFGQLRFHVDGTNRSKQELEQFGHEIMEKVTQTYIYNRVVTELKRKNMQILSEEVGQDQSVHIHLRNMME